jgi:hypothetical protein
MKRRKHEGKALAFAALHGLQLPSAATQPPETPLTPAAQAETSDTTRG